MPYHQGLLQRRQPDDLGGLLDPNIVKRGMLLPFGRTRQGEMEFAVPEVLLSLARSARLPGRVAQGYPWTPEDVTEMALNVAGTGYTGALALGRPPPGLLGSGGWYSRIAPDTLPLTGQQRGQLLSSPTLKSQPRRIVADAINKGNFPAELREEGKAFLKERAKRAAARQQLTASKYDPLASRRPGQALKDFEAKRRMDAAQVARKRADDLVLRDLETIHSIPEQELWNKGFADDVMKWSANPWSIHYAKDAVNKANLEAVPRHLKKEGWKTRYASGGGSRRKSSRYLVSPDGKFEVRLSDHSLPDTPQRQYSQETFGARWDTEVILTGREGPREVITEIKRLYLFEK